MTRTSSFFQRFANRIIGLRAEKGVLSGRINIPSLDAAAVMIVSSATLWYAMDAYRETDLADADPTFACRYPPTSKIIEAHHVRQIEHQGFTVIPNVLSPEQLSEAQRNIGSMLVASSSNKNKNKNTWSTSVHGNDEDVRSDSICWVRESDGTLVGDRERELHGDGLLHAIKLIRGAGYSVERHSYSKSHSHKVPQQCQLSRYPGNAKSIYRLHLDKCDHSMADMGLFEYWRASDYRGRALTVILYLNDADWKSGGSLRCFHTTGGQRGGGGGEPHDEGSTEENNQDRDDKGNIIASSSSSNNNNNNNSKNNNYTDVVPKGGTMIIFDSSRLEHAVLPSTKDRFALTCWLNGSTTAHAIES